ncbi:MAG: hypothetical protein MI784_17870 [Cytophagales bacterium]|nr:hypothetical protein [Cytophagales bacterium]
MENIFKQTYRFELLSDHFYDDPLVVPADSMVFVVYKKKEGNIFARTNWAVELLGEHLQQLGSFDTQESVSEELEGYGVHNGDLYLVFRGRQYGKDVIVYRVSSSLEVVMKYEIRMPVRLQFEFVEFVGAQLFVAGKTKHRISGAFLIGLEDNRQRALQGVYDKKTRLVNVRFDQERNRLMLVSKELKRNGRLLFHEFSEKGTLTAKSILSPPSGFEFFKPLVVFHDEELYWFGSYTHGRARKRHGIFVNYEKTMGDSQLQLYPFGMLKSYFDYLSPRQRARMEAKVERKLEKQNAKLNYGKMINMESFSKSNKQIVLTYSFYESRLKKRERYSRLTDPLLLNLPPYPRIDPKTTYQFSHALSLCWDFNLKLLIGDVSLPFKAEREYLGVPMVSTNGSFHDGSFSMMNYLKGKLNGRTFQAFQLEDEWKQELKPPYEGVELKAQNRRAAGVRNWGKGKSLVYGVQQVKASRVYTVFFVQKIEWQ